MCVPKQSERRVVNIKLTLKKFLLIWFVLPHRSGKHSFSFVLLATDYLNCFISLYCIALISWIHKQMKQRLIQGLTETGHFRWAEIQSCRPARWIYSQSATDAFVNSQQNLCFVTSYLIVHIVDLAQESIKIFKNNLARTRRLQREGVQITALCFLNPAGQHLGWSTAEWCGGNGQIPAMF